MRWQNAVHRLRREARILHLAYKDPRTPWYAKWLAAGTLTYALSPIDLIPDFIPVLGHLDDILILPVAVWVIIKLIPSEVLTDCRAVADQVTKPDLASRRLR